VWIGQNGESIGTRTMLVRIRWSSCEFVRMYQGKTWSQNNDWNCGLPWGKFLILILILDKLEVGQEHMHRNNVLASGCTTIPACLFFRSGTLGAGMMWCLTVRYCTDTCNVVCCYVLWSLTHARNSPSMGALLAYNLAQI
jgi:hypothetical protein